MKSGQVLLWCVMAALGACSKDPGAAPASAVQVKPKATSPARVGPTAAEQTLGMVQAAALGKSMVPVELKFELSQRPKVGQPLDVNLALIAQISASPASIQVSGSDGMTVGSGAQFDISLEEAGQVYRHSFNVTPTAEGVLLIEVTVFLKHDEVTDQRVFSIPLIADR